MRGIRRAPQVSQLDPTGQNAIFNSTVLKAEFFGSYYDNNNNYYYYKKKH